MWENQTGLVTTRGGFDSGLEEVKSIKVKKIKKYDVGETLRSEEKP